MSINLNDPRVKKTRRGLREAFVRLILRKGYDAISIQDIANEAETARITFYRHYRDKEDLLTDCLNVLYDELVEKTERITAEKVRGGYSPVRVFYDHLEEQEPLYRILFTSQGSQTVMQRLRHYMAMRVLEANDLANARLDIPVDIIAYHAASAQIGLGIWWLERDKPYPAEYMAQVSLWLSLAGLLRALGIESLTIPPPEPAGVVGT